MKHGITTYEEFIAAIGKIVEKSDRMILMVVTPGFIEIQAKFFNYKDIQRLTYILYRTPCEWWIKPINQDLITLKIRLFI